MTNRYTRFISYILFAIVFVCIIVGCSSPTKITGDYVGSIYTDEEDYTDQYITLQNGDFTWIKDDITVTGTYELNDAEDRLIFKYTIQEKEYTIIATLSDNNGFVLHGVYFYHKQSDAENKAYTLYTERINSPKYSILVAKQDIPNNVLIANKNFSDYFDIIKIAEDERPYASFVWDGIYADRDCMIRNVINAGDIILAGEIGFTIN